MDAADAAEPDAPGSLRSKLWAAVGQSKAIRSKEMQESCAFYDCVRKDVRKLRPQVVVDVCGGHGALGLLFVAHGQAQEALIIDTNQPASHGRLCDAWSSFLVGQISYDQRPLQQALPEVLKSSSKQMLVVACHACQHLAREIMDHCLANNTAFAVCPCCPKDHQGSIQAAAKTLAVDFPSAMILAEMGRLASQHCVCALRTFDEKVSPHNRVIFGRPGGSPPKQGTNVEMAEEKLRRAYARAHHAGSQDGRNAGLWSSAQALASVDDELKRKEEAVRQLLSPVTGEQIWEQLEVRASPRRHFRARTVVAVGAANPASLSPDESGGLFRFVPSSSGYQLQSTIPPDTLLPQVAAALPVLAELMTSFSQLAPVRCVKLHGTLGSSQLLCCFVYGPDILELPGDELLQELHSGLLERLGDLKSLVIMFSAKGKQRSYPAGRDFVDEVLEMKRRSVHYRQPFGQFSNPNPHIAVATAEWLGDVLQHMDAEPTDLLELYCGCGSHTVALAPFFRQVLAVEINRHLVEAAQHNVSLNGLRNVTVLRAPSEDFCRRVLRTRSYELRGAAAKAVGAETLPLNFRCTVVDPPRAGLDPVTLEAVSGYEHLLYVSCNPVALKSNLEVLLKTHKLCRMVLLDHFPFSAHVEMAVHLKKIDI